MLRKVEAIVREEMNRAGAIELLMPVGAAGGAVAGNRALAEVRPELLQHQGPPRARLRAPARPHEEVITDIARKELKSYRQLPVNFYQIQTKFRDERPPALRRDARARVHDEGRATRSTSTTTSLQREYRNMYDTYTRIFTRLGLQFRAVRGRHRRDRRHGSHEFQVLADSGEDAIAFSPGSDYAANVELAEALRAGDAACRAIAARCEGRDAGQKTCEDVAALLGCRSQRTVKSVRRATARDGSWSPAAACAATTRSTRSRRPSSPGWRRFRFADRSGDRRSDLGSEPGFLGPVGAEGHAGHRRPHRRGDDRLRLRRATRTASTSPA